MQNISRRSLFSALASLPLLPYVTPTQAAPALRPTVKNYSVDGMVKWWNKKRGFGFVQPYDTNLPQSILVRLYKHEAPREMRARIAHFITPGDNIILHSGEPFNTKGWPVRSLSVRTSYFILPAIVEVPEVI